MDLKIIFSCIFFLLKSKNRYFNLISSPYSISELTGKGRISDLDKITSDKNSFVYHAGTKLINNKVYSTGGRVLNFVSISNDLKVSRETVIKKIENLSWKNGFYRKDIGFRIIDK